MHKVRKGTIPVGFAGFWVRFRQFGFGRNWGGPDFRVQ
jgi:hypothetical protein